MNLPTDWKPAAERPTAGQIVLLYCKGTMLSFFKFCPGQPSDGERNIRDEDYFSDINSQSIIKAEAEDLFWMPATKIIEPIQKPL